MKNVTEQFGSLYNPFKAFLVFEGEKECYVQAYDVDTNGNAINAHRLSVKESVKLANILNASNDIKQSYLRSNGLLPSNVIHISPEQDGSIIWHTQEQTCKLFFSEHLNIPNGRARTPALLWKANKETLYVYALKSVKNIQTDTLLYHAPFFNIYNDGKVCMGNTRIRFGSECQLEEFIDLWQKYFFNSYFSHSIEGAYVVNGNIVNLWNKLIGTDQKFPIDRLKKSKLTIKNLI